MTLDIPLLAAVAAVVVVAVAVVAGASSSAVADAAAVAGAADQPSHAPAFGSRRQRKRLSSLWTFTTSNCSYFYTSLGLMLERILYSISTLSEDIHNIKL